jgi:hypothetical protein
LTKRYRDVDLHPREGTTVEMVEQVLDRVLAVAILSLPVEGWEYYWGVQGIHTGGP